MPNITYETWIDFAEMGRGEEHRWFFDPVGWDPSYHVIQATATPLTFVMNETWDYQIENSVEVSRIFYLRKGSNTDAPGECQVNIWVKNIGANLARYRLDVTLTTA